ncbi:MAG: YhcB family protein [Gammaproteobacteria bacterium]|nr:YhcB family protein [Gammaproteobacteria bacterium]
MESIDPVWLFGGIALLAGVLLGVVICRRFTPTITDVDELRVKLEQSRSELDRYRDSVNGHFNKTSDLINELTQDYVKVYQHLAEGAQNLSDAPEFSRLLEHRKDKEPISMDEEVGAQDTAEAGPEDFSAQGFAAEVLVPEVSEAGDSIAEDAAGEKTASEDAPGDVDDFEPLDAHEDDKAKAAAANEAKPDPTARTDTQ